MKHWHTDGLKAFEQMIGLDARATFNIYLQFFILS